MKTAIGVGSAYYNGEDWDELVDYTIAADNMGVDFVWSAEAWGMDAIVPLAYLAAKTKNITLGTGPPTTPHKSKNTQPTIHQTFTSVPTEDN